MSTIRVDKINTKTGTHPLEVSTILPKKVSGTATFTNIDNNINLTNVGNIGFEIGDVISVSGSTNNDKYFTVEVITDNDNIIVNQAHAGGTTIKSLIDETATVTVELLVKWYNAPLGLGQGWVDVTSSRLAGVTYSNLTNRLLKVHITFDNASGNNIPTKLFINNEAFDGENSGSGNTERLFITGSILINSDYRASSLGGTLNNWKELR